MSNRAYSPGAVAVEHAIIDIDLFEITCATANIKRENAFRRLRHRSFIRAKNEAYYNPKHWRLMSSFEMTQDCGDFYIDSVAFIALTPEARRYAKKY